MNSKARKAYDAQLEVALKDDEDGYTGTLSFPLCGRLHTGVSNLPIMIEL